jgi:hypothetical protein
MQHHVSGFTEIVHDRNWPGGRYTTAVSILQRVASCAVKIELM